jgi:cytokinin trans-hydroxylase
MAVMMMVLTSLLVIFIFSFLKVAYDNISCYFLTPRRIKKIMEKQGVRGPKPRPLTGNILDVAAYVSKSTSKDMDHITHDTVNRLLPHYVAWSKQYGTQAYLTVETTGIEPET